MTITFWIIILSCFIAHCNGESESFIVTKKNEIKKKESRSYVQEDIASCLLHDSKSIAYSIESESRLLRELQECGEALLSQDKKKAINQASTQELQELRSTLQDFSSQLASWQKKVDDTYNKIHRKMHVCVDTTIKKK